MHPLDAIFTPRSVAVIGASETPGSVGRTVMSNLLAGPLRDNVIPVNPRRTSVLGHQACPSVTALPHPVDLAIIVTPAPTVPEVIGQCADAGIPGAVIISAGFKELGAEGVELERRVLEQAQRGNMRVVGPNCLGVMNPHAGLNATFAGAMALPGNVAFLSQSGALCTAILDWSLRELVGFSAFASTGSMLDVGWGDLIDYLGDDPRTHSILIYMESIGDARAFLSAAREVALSKPIIVIKAGRTEAAAKAAASHTGALTGSDEVLDAAFRRVGVLRVNNIADLFYMAEVLSRQPRPKGPRLTILTNAGGPGVLATDALIGAGGELATLAPNTVAQLNAFLPKHWSRSNPIDILGDAGPDRYAKSLQIAVEDPNSDGLLVILTPQDMTQPTQTADALVPYAKASGKPVLASWMGGPAIRAGEEILNRSGIPTFAYPDTAARAFQYMWRYSDNLRGIYETPQFIPAGDATGSRDPRRLISEALLNNRTLLDEEESKRLLNSYDIPTVATHVALSADEARRSADAMGYPVVLKLYSKTITHKTDVGGVRLDLTSGHEVVQAFDEIRAAVTERRGSEHFQGVTVQPMVRISDGYELILGSSIDPQFGPVMLFGAGGQLVEILKDRALGLPPLNATLARRMIEQTRIYAALLGIRGRKSVDIDSLVQVLVRVSRLVVEHPRIKEIDINPLVISADQMLALDARVVLFGDEIPDDHLPRPAIRPYPAQFVSSWVMKDGSPATLRPICPEDEPMLVRFHQTLSDLSVQQRYFHAMKLSHRVAHERLTRICFIDYDREIALIAERQSPVDRQREMVGVGRLVKTRGHKEAEFAVLVSDSAQNQGIGKELLRRLIQIAGEERVERLWSDILIANTRMQHLCESLGFHLEHRIEDGVVRAASDLTLTRGTP